MGRHLGNDPEFFQKLMGRGGAITSRPQSEPEETQQSAEPNQVATPSQPAELPKTEFDTLMDEIMAQMSKKG